MSSRAESLPPESLAIEWVRIWAFAARNLIMARRNVFFVFELTFLPGVAMLSHGLLTRFLALTPQMTAFILVGTVALSSIQVCQLDVAYAVLFDISNNIGDSRSLMCHNASPTHYSVSAEAREEMGVTEGMLRLNVGLEDPDDVIDDLDRALKAVGL